MKISTHKYNMYSTDRSVKPHRVAILAASILALPACHWTALQGGSSSGGSTPTYTVSGTVAGLTGTGLVLSVNGVSVPVSSSGTVSIVTNLKSGTPYSVSVQTQPTGQTCSVAGGSGTIGNANVANVVVTCAANAFSVGGTVSGLNGSGLVLADAAGSVTVASGATSFTLPGTVAQGSSYSVAVQTQPVGLACAIGNGTGTMGSANVTHVTVTCTDQPFSVGGSITGLGNNTGLVLTNGGDTLQVTAASTSFTLPTQVPFGSPYAVQVQASPSGLTCAAANASGTMGAANVTNVAITCSDQSFNVGGTVTGLTSGTLVLTGGSNDSISVSSTSNGNATFTLPLAVPYTAAYSVTVQTAPTGVLCTVSNGSGTMPAAAVTNVTVACSAITYTLGGSISGLTSTGLVLANGTDTVPPAANATSFTMPTAVAYGASYNITVKTQPTGELCTVTHGSGTATSNVSSVASVSCIAVNPYAVATDAQGDLFVADDATNAVYEMAYSAGVYQAPVVIGSNFSTPYGIAVDASGNVFVTDNSTNPVKEIPYNHSSGYGSLTQIGVSNLRNPFGVAVDASGNLFVTDFGNNAVYEIPYSNGGGFGSPTQIGSNFSHPRSVTVDRSGNVFVADSGHNAVYEIPYSNGGGFGSPTQIGGSSFNYPIGVSVDASGNVFVADWGNNAVKEIAAGNGTVTSLGSGFHQPYGVAVDANGDVFVADTYNSAVKEIAYSNGSYGATVTLGSGFSYPHGVAVDASGNVFVADYGNSAVKEIAAGNGTVTSLGSGLNPYGVAVDASGNVFVADYDNNAVKEIPYSAGSYGTPTSIGSGFGNPTGVAVDASGNVFVADLGNNAVKEIPYSAGSYGTPTSIGSGFSSLLGVAVDASGNVFVTDSANSAVKKIPYSGHYTAAPVVLW